MSVICTTLSSFMNDRDLKAARCVGMLIGLFEPQEVAVVAILDIIKFLPLSFVIVNGLDINQIKV